jgi:starch-binding outer membrane protein, SusD/RagB family
MQMTTMRLRAAVPATMRLAALAAGLCAAAAGCADLDVVDPNERSTGSFWKTQNDAIAGTTATYSGLLPLGTYGRWQVFVNDMRSDIATAQASPWADLANYGRFTLSNYDWEINGHVWVDHYRAIFRANQAIGRIPTIPDNQIAPALRDRLTAENKAIRALLYFNLVNYFGGNIPLVLDGTGDPTLRVPSSTVAAVYAQIEQDLTEAIPALPLSYTGADVARVTKGAAQTLLGKAHLQQKEWALAAAALAPVISSNQYELLTDYAANFRDDTESGAGRGPTGKPESIFEVQFGDESTLSSNVPGLSFTRMIGPCGPGFCDVRPTRWYFDQFMVERTTDAQLDPRLDATIFWNQPTRTERVWQREYRSLWGSPTDDRLFFKKYTEWWKGERDFQRWDSPINFRVLRYADVLLMQAEALNEQGQPQNAVPLVNLVRQRARLSALPTTVNQTDLRAQIRHQRLLEFGLEAQRWFDLVRYGELENAAALVARDADFTGFIAGKSAVLPIPGSEINRNQAVTQNPGY